MVLTSFPSELPISGKIRARILNDTVCEIGDVVKDQVVEVSGADFLKLKYAGKAELADAGDVIAEAVADEPAAEVAEISEVAADAAAEVSDASAAEEAPAPRRGRR